MAIKDGDDDYAVGYSKPPKHSQFQKGTSGNKKGRPKGSRSVATAFHSELNQKISVNENGEYRRITKLEAVIKQVVNKAATGDTKAMRTLLQISRELGDLKVPDTEEEVVITLNLPKPPYLQDKKED